MNFLCDVHITNKLVRFLKNKNCSATHINQIFSDPKTPDSGIIKYADANGCIIITKDVDFKESFLLYGKPKRLIKLNIGNSSTVQMLNLFEKNWDFLRKTVESKPTFFIESDLINFFMIEIDIK